MGRKIYVKMDSARRLERAVLDATADGDVVFAEEPESGFPVEIELSEFSLKDNRVIDARTYRPNFDKDLEGTVETMVVHKELLTTSKTERLQSKSPAERVEEYKKAKSKRPQKVDEVSEALIRRGDIYRCFVGEDAECWAKCLGGKIHVADSFRFQLNMGSIFDMLVGGSGPNIFFLKQEANVYSWLLEGAGIYINRKTVVLCNHHRPQDINYENPEPDIIRMLSRNDRVSADGNCYKLFQDYDGGARGWAYFVKVNKNGVEILDSDHNDNVRERLRDWAQGISHFDFKILGRYDHNFYEKPYPITVEDFLEDFHVDEDGTRRPY